MNITACRHIMSHNPEPHVHALSNETIAFGIQMHQGLYEHYWTKPDGNANDLRLAQHHEGEYRRLRTEQTRRRAVVHPGSGRVM